MKPLVKFCALVLLFTLCIDRGCGEVVTVCKQYNPATEVLPECEGETVIMVKSNQQTGEESFDECAKEKIREIVRNIINENTKEFTTRVTTLLATTHNETTRLSVTEATDDISTAQNTKEFTTRVTTLLATTHNETTRPSTIEATDDISTAQTTKEFTTRINRLLNTTQDQRTKVSTLKTSDETTVTPMTTRNCDDVARQGHVKSGTFYVLLNGSLVEVYCELSNDSGNWLVFQNRFSGEVDFYLNWKDYQAGFGNKSGEFWLGLEYLHVITSSSRQRLRVELEDWNGTSAYAEYSSFWIGNSSTNYRLNVGGYNGTAGDSLAYHHNQPFTTKDRDNDQWPNNYAVFNHGAWWYSVAHSSNLNSLYMIGGVINIKGINWYDWKQSWYSMKKTRMKVQPVP